MIGRNLSTFQRLALVALFVAACGAAHAQGAKNQTPKLLEGLAPGTYAFFHTNQGDFVAKLFTDLAPVSADNFIGLAQGTRPFMNSETNQEEKRPFYCSASEVP